MPVTNQPPPSIFIPDDNNWHQIEEAVILIGGWGRTLNASGRIRIRHVWTGAYYEYEPTPEVDFSIYLPAWYNKIDGRVLPGGAGLGGGVSVAWS
jgi:hypothetical protein